MASKKLDKKATVEAIISKAQKTSFMSIDIAKIRKKKWSVKDLKELCDAVRTEPVYQDNGNSIVIPEFKAPELSNCRSFEIPN